MGKEKLRFFITEYADGGYEIETKHMHYAFRSDINVENIERSALGDVMNMITKILDKENFQPYFVMN